MPRAKHGGSGRCDRNGQSADRLSANLRFFLNCASPFSSFFECNFDTGCVFCMRMVQYACFSKSELDKWSFFCSGVRSFSRVRQRSNVFFPRARTRAQRFFAFSLHLFTWWSQLLVVQWVKCEGFWFVLGEGACFASLHPFLHSFLAGSVLSNRRSMAAEQNREMR